MTDAIEIRHYVNRAGKEVFDAWLSELADTHAQAKVAARINRLAAGNFGDCKSLGQGLCELRIDWRSGYRVYYVVLGKSRVLLLCAATSKNNRQTLGEHWRTSRTTRKGPEFDET
jgi:putative addiction module killer protein